ncbi:hypothetical protein TUBRATIS_20850 [Tubulinosema ratisbonensis]|uniref:Trm112p-like protein n=1 Tax=Tubulinosema ratisbonensis TaxID=291195 RepID=A0A437AJZ6_9MICR|nr:hypothetical protein TUBRATIS_20850 [Tubulinosema ratisbonensis]
MKPFLLELLKCNNCTNLTNLSLKIKKSKKIEYDLDKLPRIPSKELINELNQIFKECNGFYLDKSDMNNLSEDNAKLIKLLFCNEVIEGELHCKGCNEEYFINEGIPSFVKN